MRATFLAAAPLALATLAIGCEGRPPAPIPVPVTGTVTFDGRPLDGALVSFYPGESNADRTTGEGRTAPDGSYRARTGDRWGLMPGAYRIQVTSRRPEEVKVGESFRLYGHDSRKISAPGGEVNLDLKLEPQNDSY